MTDRFSRLTVAYILAALSRDRTLAEEVLRRQQNKPRPSFLDENGFFLSVDNKRFVPYEEQTRFIESNASLSIFIGGRGSGKTAAGTQKALRLAILEGKSGMVANPDFQNLVFSTWQAMREWIPPEAVVSEHRYMLDPSWIPRQSFYIRFSWRGKQSTVWFKGLKSQESGVGANLEWIWVDEGAREADGTPILRALASARIGNPVRFITSTPKGKRNARGDENWLFSLYRQALEGDTSIQVFKGDVTKNPGITPSYIQELQAIYGEGTPLGRQEIYGEFVDFVDTAPDTSKFILIAEDDVTTLFSLRNIVRYWDLAASKTKRSDYTVGTKVAEATRLEDGATVYIVMDQIAERTNPEEVYTLIASIAERDGYLVKQVIEEEPGASGKLFYDALRAYFNGVGLYSDALVSQRPFGNRVQAAKILWYHHLEAGKVYVVRGKWNVPFFEEVSVFPLGTHDDRVTSFTGAMYALQGDKERKRINDLPFHALRFNL